MKDLTIVIVTFNSAAIIKNCLSKLNFEKYDVVVVDNASTDNTALIVERDFPKTKIIKSEKNIGYGRGNNLALREVKTEFALILNPDAYVGGEAIERVLQVIGGDEKVALAAPLLLSKNPIDEEDKTNQLKIVESNAIEKFADFISVKYIIGAAVFLKMSVFEKIGFFDEEIFLYYEDDEITWRAVKNGFKAAIIPDVFAFHIGHASSGSSLRGTYKRFWHRALSKLHWKKKQKGKFSATKSALRLVLVFFIKTIFYLIIFNTNKAVANIASCFGSFAFLINMKAFDKNDNARG
jgi:GT2 family glycosyltransferase